MCFLLKRENGERSWIQEKERLCVCVREREISREIEHGQLDVVRLTVRWSGILDVTDLASFNSKEKNTYDRQIEREREREREKESDNTTD